MKYYVKLLPSAEKDVEKLKKSGDKQAIKKLDKLLNELREHPTFGTGHPEQLRHRKGNIWSRHITDTCAACTVPSTRAQSASKHRLVYEIFDDFIMVEVQQTYGHYDDK